MFVLILLISFFEVKAAFVSKTFDEIFP